MKTTIITVFLTLFASSAFARTIECGGTEPFWNLSVQDHSMTFIDPVLQQSTKLAVTSRQNAVGYAENNIVVVKAKKSSLTLILGECNDGMSDTVYSHHAAFDHNGKIFGGCCNFKN